MKEAAPSEIPQIAGFFTGLRDVFAGMYNRRFDTQIARLVKEKDEYAKLIAGIELDNQQERAHAFDGNAIASHAARIAEIDDQIAALEAKKIGGTGKV